MNSDQRRTSKNHILSRRTFVSQIGAGATAGALTSSSITTAAESIQATNTKTPSPTKRNDQMTVQQVATFTGAMQAVNQAIRTKQIGTPVALRIVTHLPADLTAVQRFAADVLVTASKWFGSEFSELSAGGGSGQISTLARFVNGQTALVSVGSNLSGLEIIVWGNRGTLSWEADSEWLLATEETPESDVTSDLSEKVDASITTSLKSGQPVHFGGRTSISQTPDRSEHPSAAVVANPETDNRANDTPRAGQNPPYGVLLVAGDHTHQPTYAQALATDPRCKLVGLTDETGLTPRRSRLNKQLADRLGIPLFPNPHEALARDDVHIVSVCAEPRRRGRLIVQAAEAGKHLYLDKPLAGSLREADEIVAAVRRAGVVSHMFSQVRSDTAARVRQIIQSGQLGKLLAVHFDLCFAKGPAGTAELGKQRQESATPKVFELLDSKRELSNVGVYPLVMLLSSLGSRVENVYASTGNYFFQEHQKNNMEDFGQLLLQVEGNVTCTISVGRTGWRSSPSGVLDRTYLVGSETTAVVDAHRPRLEVWADVKSWTAPKRNPVDPMAMWGGSPEGPFSARPKQAWFTAGDTEGQSDTAYFLDCIEQGRESKVSAGLAAATTEVLMAAYQSAATGKSVRLPLPR